MGIRFTMKLNQYTWIVGLYFFVNGCNARSSMRADVVSATMGGETTTTVRAETTTTTTNYPPNGCPTGWVDSQDRGCFLFHYTQADNWFEAQHECERVGGFLAEPKTYEQATLLTSLALLEESIIGVNSWWIGLSDLGHDGRWLWQHSVSDLEFSNWAPGYPTNQFGADCVLMSLADNFAWTDRDCIQARASPICQREWNDGGSTTTTPAWGTTTTIVAGETTTTWYPGTTTTGYPYTTTTQYPYTTTTRYPYTTTTGWSE